MSRTTSTDEEKDLSLGSSGMDAADLPVFECSRDQQQVRAGELLELPPPPGYLEMWADTLSEASEKEQRQSDALFVFRLENEWLALPAKYIREVSRPLPIHRIPRKSDNILLGLVNIRGRLQLCFSLKALLGLDQMAGSGKNEKQIFSDRYIEAERDGFGWIFPVDEILDIHQYNLDDAQNVPLTVANASVNYTNAVFLHEGKTVGCLDDELIISFLKRRIL